MVTSDIILPQARGSGYLHKQIGLGVKRAYTRNAHGEDFAGKRLSALLNRRHKTLFGARLKE